MGAADTELLQPESSVTFWPPAVAWRCKRVKKNSFTFLDTPNGDFDPRFPSVKHISVLYVVSSVRPTPEAEKVSNYSRRRKKLRQHYKTKTDSTTYSPLFPLVLHFYPVRPRFLCSLPYSRARGAWDPSTPSTVTHLH